MTLLPFSPAHQLASRPAEERWLIDGLFAEEAVGIVGGEPKCCKSFLALDMAVSVASGTPCLRRYPVSRPGRVLLYAAEDALHVVRARLEGICLAAGADFGRLDLQVITARSLRLDTEADRRRLADTVSALRPRLLVLDPFVRLHRIDENAAAEVAPLLGFLRDLQGACHVAVALVHHAKKGAGSARAGQALRGSSEFHAWGDSNLYLRREGERLTLWAEHRAAPSTDAIELRLEGRGEALALALVAPGAPGSTAQVEAPRPPDARGAITQALGLSATAVPYEELRRRCAMRNATLWAALGSLLAQGRVRKTADGYVLGVAQPA